jgi:hypothetical protein
MAVERRRTGRLHPKDRSVSGGRRQPSLLLREECGAAAGEEGRRSRCRPRPGRRQTRRDERPYRASPASSAENDAGGRRLISTLSAAGASALPLSRPPRLPRSPTMRAAPDTAQTMSSTMPAQDGETEPLQSRTCSNQAGASKSESNDAISASGALNRPRLSSGGTTASTASSFSEGSMRR